MSVKKRLKNSEMVEMLRQLQPILSRRDVLGYMAARNYRILSESLTEYHAMRQKLLEKYGEEQPDENGIPMIQLKFNSPAFKQFADELAPFNEMEHEVELMIGKYSDAIGSLSGEEILAIDWMLED